MSKEQTALERIKDEVAKEYYKVNTYEELYKASNALPFVDSIIDIIAERHSSQAVEDYKEKLKADISKMMTLNGITRHPFKVEAAEILKLIDSIK